MRLVRAALFALPLAGGAAAAQGVDPRAPEVRGALIEAVRAGLAAGRSAEAVAADVGGQLRAGQRLVPAGDRTVPAQPPDGPLLGFPRTLPDGLPGPSDPWPPGRLPGATGWPRPDLAAPRDALPLPHERASRSPRNRPLLVAQVWSALRRRDPQEAASVMRASPHWRWHLDKVFVKINGVQHYLWRAVGHAGEVPESVVTKTRDRKAALKFLGKSMRRCGRPERIVTDKLRSQRHRFKQNRTTALAQWRPSGAA